MPGAPRSKAHVTTHGPPVTAVALLLMSGCGSTEARLDPLELPVAPGQMVYETVVNFEPADGFLEARSQLSLFPSDPGVGELTFLLNGALEIQDLKGAAVRSYRSDPFEPVPSWDVVTVELDPERVGEGPIQIEISWAGQFGEGDSWVAVSERVIELNADVMWHPLVASGDQAAAGVLRINLPAHWEVVGPGELETVSWPGHARGGDPGSGDPRAATTRRLVTTAPSPDIAFTASPDFSRVEAPGAIVHVLGDAAPAAEAVARVASQCVGHLNGRYGLDDRISSAQVVLLDRPGPGYARGNYIVLSEVDPGDDVGLYRFVCHELAHFWTASPGPMSPDYWMAETFAEYTMGLAVADLLGPEVFQALVADWRARGECAGPVWTPEMTGRAGPAAMYALGPALLEDLRDRIPSDAFGAFIAGAMVEPIDRTRELLALLEALAGPGASAWFEGALVSEGCDSIH